MSWTKRVLNVFRPARLSGDLDREISFHIEEAIDRLVEDGMDLESATREAHRRFGHRPTHVERTRDMDVVTWLESLLADLRYAGRSLRSAPVFTLVAVLSLGLGIGANTAIFSLLNSVILKSLPVSHPEHLVKLAMDDPNLGPSDRSGGEDVFTNPLWEAIRDKGPAFDGIFAIGNRQYDLAESGETRNTSVSLISGQFFSTLAVRPSLGRLLDPSDDRPGCAPVAVLSYGFWQRNFGGQAGVIGRTLSLNRHPVTIVGVTDPTFAGIEVGRSPQIYAPLCSAPVLSDMPDMLEQRSRWWLNLMARLPDGATAEEVTARLGAVAPDIFRETLPANWGTDDQQKYLKRTILASPAPTGLSSVRLRYRTSLAILMGVVSVVLLIACANVANLLLARAAARQREIAMRLAIGASRGRIIRQALTESLLLSAIGASVGLLFARWSSSLLLGMITYGGGPVLLDLSVDSRVLGFTTLVAMGTGLLFGVAPAWRSVALQPQSVLKSGTARVSATRASVMAGKVLVVGQVALSLVLVVGAGLLLGTFRELVTTDPGFRADGVVLATVRLTGPGLPAEEQEVRSRELLQQIRSQPDVMNAGAAVITPLSGNGWNGFVFTEGYQPRGEQENLVWFNGVTDGYFAALGIQQISGRDFDGSERARGPRVAIVNQDLARRIFGEANPIGRQIWVQNTDQPEPPMEIIGVVSSSKYVSLRDSLAPTVYVPSTQADGFNSLSYVVRTRGAPAAVTSGILTAAKQVLPGSTVQLNTLSGQLAQSLSRERLLAMLSTFFGGLALLLALIGLYGTMAYNVTRKRREIGIRVALGATRVRLVRLVAGEAGRMIVAGVIVGELGVLATTRLVGSFLYGRSPLDPLTLLLATMMVAGIALIAGMIPALRAVRQDPGLVLRED